MPKLGKLVGEIRRHGETSAATAKAIKALEEQYEARWKDLDAALTEIKQDVATRTAIKSGGKAAGPASIGAAFIESDAYKAANESRPETGQVEVKSFFGERKTLFTDASVGTVPVHMYESRREP